MPTLPGRVAPFHSLTHFGSSFLKLCVCARLHVRAPPHPTELVMFAQAMAGSLQSLCWASAAAGGILSAYFSGSLVGDYGTQ